jgi:hypothetical protein
MWGNNCDSVRRMPAEKALWLAVLDQALNDLTFTGYASPSEELHVQRSAYSWLWSDSREPGSFLFVCDILEIDSAWFRKQLFATSPDELKKRLAAQHRGDIG